MTSPDPYAEARERGAEALRTRDNNPDPVSMAGPEQFYGVMATVVLTAIHFSDYLALAEAAQNLGLETVCIAEPPCGNCRACKFRSALADIKEGT